MERVDLSHAVEVSGGVLQGWGFQGNGRYWIQGQCAWVSGPPANASGVQNYDISRSTGCNSNTPTMILNFNPF